MKRLMICAKPGIILPVLGVLLVLTQSNFATSAGERKEEQLEQTQQPPTPTPAPAQSSQAGTQQISRPDQSAAKPRKIWTNDDLVLLRTPADIYLLEKEQREAAEADAAAKLAAQSESPKGAPVEFKLPATIEETQLLIKVKEQEITDAQAKLAKLNSEIGSVADEQREAKQTEINVTAAELDLAQSEFKALREHIVLLQRPPIGETPEAPPTPPTPPST